MKNQKLMVIQILFQQRVAKLSEQYFLECEEKSLGLESGPEHSRYASVNEYVIIKQDYTKSEPEKFGLSSLSAADFPTVFILAVNPVALHIHILVFWATVFTF